MRLASNAFLPSRLNRKEIMTTIEKKSPQNPPLAIEKNLANLLDLLLLQDYEILLEEEDNTHTHRIAHSEQDTGIIIGHHGETIASLQRLLRIIYLEQLQDKRLIVNINDYRDSREIKIREMIEKGIDKISRYGGSYHLYRLNSSERFYAHNFINENPDLADYTSYSQDEEEGRVLIIERRS